MDAWWVEPVTAEQRQRIVRLLEDALSRFGQVRIRSWGDVTSVELRQNEKTVFGFQIARRSAELQTPQPGLWPGGIRLDSFDDLLAAKVVALVERGAPRDFRDIYTLCRSGQTDVARCWNLWQRRQRLAGEDTDGKRAAVAVRTHLARLEQARPLAQIADAGQRAAAEQVRTWFIAELLRDLPD